jgi:hypothetical protein
MPRLLCHKAASATSFSTGKMADRNHLNAYAGPNALRDYFDPDIQPMLPLVEIPQSLNPFYTDGVRIHAKMMSMHPANNVKIMPGMFMYLKRILRQCIIRSQTAQHSGC